MTPSRCYNLMRPLNLILSRVAFWMSMAALGVFASGCFAPFIPLAIQGVGMVAKMVGVGAEAGTMVKHGDDQNPEETEVYEQTALDESDFDASSAKKPANAAKCNALELITPAIVEFRTDREGATQWRELGLGGSADSPRWTVMAEAAGTTAKDVAPTSGWSAASNLSHMEFSPPLETSASPGYATYLAYAPAASLNGVERDELASLMLDFGPATGTFKYNGRVFKYSTLKKLPCFPVPQ
jgi:hypothetical protein